MAATHSVDDVASAKVIRVMTNGKTRVGVERDSAIGFAEAVDHAQVKFTSCAGQAVIVAVK